MDQPFSQAFEVDDAVVVLLGSPTNVGSLDGEIKGITRLEKLMFLLEKNSQIARYLDEPLEFKSFNYGPFSEKIYQAIDMLAAAGLVSDSAQASQSTEDMWESQEVIGDNENRESYITRDIKLTERGKRYYQALAKELPEEVLSEVSEIKLKYGVLPLRKLVRYVYQTFPNYTDKSVIRDEILSG